MAVQDRERGKFNTTIPSETSRERNKHVLLLRGTNGDFIRR